jgi:hypothetical protein
MNSIIGLIIWRITVCSFGLFNYFLYLGLAIRNGTFFRKSTEKEKNEFLLGSEIIFISPRTT